MNVSKLSYRLGLWTQQSLVVWTSLALNEGCGETFSDRLPLCH